MSLIDPGAIDDSASPASRTMNLPRRQEPFKEDTAASSASPTLARQPKLTRSGSTGIDLGRGSASLGVIQLGTSAQDFSTPARSSNDDSQTAPMTNGSPLSKFRIDSSYVTSPQKPLSDELLFTPIPTSGKLPSVHNNGLAVTDVATTLEETSAGLVSPLNRRDKTALSSSQSTPSQPVSDLAITSPEVLRDSEDESSTVEIETNLERPGKAASHNSEDPGGIDMDDTFRMHDTTKNGHDLDDDNLSQISSTSAFSSLSQAAENMTRTENSVLHSSDETFSPIISRSTSYAQERDKVGEARDEAHRNIENNQFSQDLQNSWNINPLERIGRPRPMSEGQPMIARLPSPKRAASVEVLAASTCGDNEQSEQPDDYDHIRNPADKNASAHHESSKQYMTREKFVNPHTVSQNPSISSERPTTAETTGSSGSHRGERDTVPDISYEQSFMPPLTEQGDQRLINDILDPVSENEEAEHSPSRLASEDRGSIMQSTAEEQALHAFQSGQQSTPDALVTMTTPKQSDSRYSAATSNPEALSASPQVRNGLPLKAWETPAANKQYINDLPTRTAISRRVENFQIPPDRLAALQPEIAAMHTRNRRPSDKLSLKESSAQIDALLNENWGLKMKIMFMDQHFEHDRDKAELIAENVRLQTNGYNFVQQVKARDKTIKALQKEVNDLEYSKASTGRKSSVTSQEFRNAEDKIVELEDYIKFIEDNHAKLVTSLQNSLASSSSELQLAEERLHHLQDQADGTTTAEIEAITAQNEELRESLAEAEEELEQREHEYEDHLAELSKELEDKHEALLISQEEIREISQLLSQCEADLGQSDQIRQLELDELRDFYENEGLEYQKYIEDRHEEIDNLKQAMNSYNQGSFDARLAEALRPHQQAWHEISQQCTELREELSGKETQWLQEREALEYQLEGFESREKHLLTEISALKDEALYKQEQMDELERDRVELQSQVESLREEHQSVLSTRSTLDQQALSEGLQLDIDTLQSKADEAEATREAALASVRDLTTELEAMRKEKCELMRALQDITAKLELEQGLHAAALKISEDLEERCRNYEHDLEELHASLDEAKRGLSVLRDDTTKQRDEERGVHEEHIKKMQEKITEHQQDLQSSQKEVVIVKEEIQRISQILNTHLSDEKIRHVDICQAISEHLESQQEENASLKQRLDKAHADLEDSAYALKEYQRKSEQEEAELKALEKKYKEGTIAKEKLDHQLRTQIAASIETEKALKDAQRAYGQARQASEQAIETSNALLSNLLQKLYTLLPPEEQKSDMLHASDFNSLSTALQTMLGLLRQHAQHAARAQKMADADFRKQLAERESQLTSKAQQVDALKNKIDEWKSKHNELSQQQAASESKVPRRATAAMPKQEQSRAQEQVSRQVSTNSNGSASNTEDYWTLHERIKALNRDLKYQKELREQDDKAARQRLTESKKENKDLQSKVHQLLEASGKPRSLTLDRTNDKYGRSGSRASLNRVENHVHANDDVD